MQDATKTVHAGRDPAKHKGFVNVPTYRGSTVLFDSVQDYLAAGNGRDLYDGSCGFAGDLSYGTSGTPTAYALARAVADLEGAESCALAPSGLAALTGTFSAYLKSGDVFLVPDSVYGPVRRFCRTVLPRFNVETRYYDPTKSPEEAGISDEKVALILLESPGSLTFEMQDIPAYAKAAKASGVVSCMDNSWASPLYFKPLAHGVDLSIEAGTKYIGGHSDVLLGTVAGASDKVDKIRQYFHHTGVCVSPDDCSLAARGLRTMQVRLDRHSESAVYIARALESHDKIARVMFPALPSDPGHELWKRDFSGAGGLFSVALGQDYAKEVLHDAINGLHLFGIGASWGGYESLALPFDPNAGRKKLRYGAASYVRFFIGLEHPDDLLADITRMLDRLP